ncbi:hypothetical protein ACGF5M_03605 [Gemmatimonadota bacterium]
MSEADDKRRYSDEEFALILRRAVEIEGRHDPDGGRSPVEEP